VLIPCKDERRHIRECIESVRDLADEILVADSGSTDGTLQIARGLGCRVIERNYVNSANFKNWAIPQARHDWVLVVDADERVTPALAAEIRRLLAAGPREDAFELKRDLFFLGHRINHCGVSHNFLVRLFRRDECRYQARRVHADVVVPSGKIGRLAERMLHYSALDIDHFLAKQQRYSTWAALDAYEAGKRISLARMLVHTPLRFAQLYLFRGGWLDGRAGLVVCGIMAYYTFLKDARLWALRSGKTEEQLAAVADPKPLVHYKPAGSRSRETSEFAA
ncbi:MAG: glycosyltransferase family 2 protein, partial [Planctomycetaceae bacterium]|nr:glycosyltransferase family 2 protein [Planctomycetaceae bacterium]